MTIQDSSTLVFLNISQWGARRHDKAASLEIAQAHGAGDAGRFNKLLIDKAHLAEIGKCVSALRTTHYDLTLPWQDDGARLLPNALFLKYTQAMSLRRQAFEAAVSSFVKKYPTLREEARKRLGTLYRPEDYPLDISFKFQSRLDFSPVPSVDDFRVSAADESAELIRQQVTMSVNESMSLRQKEAISHCKQRVRECLERVRDRCSAAKPVIHESLMGEVQTLIEILPAMNLTNDPGLARLADALLDVRVPVQRLRNSGPARKGTAASAELALTLLESL